MKLTTKNYYSGFSHSNIRNQKEILYKDTLLAQKNENQEKYKPAQAISFGGSYDKIAQNIANKLVESKVLNKATEFVGNNEVVFTALVSLVVTGIIKPMFVINTKGADEKDKQYIATKNFLSAFIGTFLNLTIGGILFDKATKTITNNLSLLQINKETNMVEIIKDANDEIPQKAKDLAEKILQDKQDGLIYRIIHGNKKIAIPQKDINQKAAEIYTTAKNHLKIFQDHPDFTKQLLSKEHVKKGVSTTLYDTYKTIAKNLSGSGNAILKAMIASSLLPIVTAKLFPDRNKPKEKHNTDSLLTQSKTFNQEKAQNFSTFNKKSDNISFKGSVLDTLVNLTATGVEKITFSKPGQAFVNGLANLPPILNNATSRMSDLESFILTGYWVASTSTSKKIPPSQKLGLNCQTVLVTLISSISAFLVDTLCDGIIKNAKDAYKDKLTDVVKQAQQKAQEISPKEVKDFVAQNTQKLFASKEIVEKLFNGDAIKTNANNIDKIIEDLASDYGKKFRKLKSLTIFTLVVRFLVPVLTVKPAAKVKKFIQTKMEEKEKRKAKQA